MILLDSSSIIHFLRGEPTVVRRFQQESPRELRIPAIVAYEIGYGILKSRRAPHRSRVTRMLEAIPQVPFDGAAAAEAAHIRADLEERGFSIGPMDLLIAATAVSRGAVLVTSNTKEFRRVKHLRLADWAAE